MLATTLVGTTVRRAAEESAKGALLFVESSSVVFGVLESKGSAGGTNDNGYSATPATTRKFEIRPLNTAQKQGREISWA